MELTQYLEIDENNIAIGGVYNGVEGEVPSNWIPLQEGVGFGWKWNGTSWEDNRSYIVKRQDSYPAITEQLDMMYHDQVNGTTTWLDTIKAVKDKYPKE